MVEDFWEWLPKAYRDGDLGDEPMFTKYDMETAFAAGAETEAKRMWVGLNFDELPDHEFGNRDFILGARWAEAKLKEKNHG
jgi:hypothetical protein